MTDEELKRILLAPFHPDGKATWNRIEELKGREQTLKCVLAGERILHEDLEARIEELEALAQALIDDVRARYPGEELRCPHMIALDEALKGTDDEG